MEKREQDNQIDIVTELQSDETMPHRPVGDTKHQFMEDGLKYEKRRHLAVWLVVVALAAAAIGYFLLQTEQGQALLNPAETETPADSNFPVSYNSSSSASTIKAFIIPERDFTDTDNETILLQMEEDITAASNYKTETEIWELFQTQVEFGVKARSAAENEKAAKEAADE